MAAMGVGVGVLVGVGVGVGVPSGIALLGRTTQRVIKQTTKVVTTRWSILPEVGHCC